MGDRLGELWVAAPPVMDDGGLADAEPAGDLRCSDELVHIDIDVRRSDQLCQNDSGPGRPGDGFAGNGNLYLHGVGITATMHQLRHWMATTLYGNTLDLRLVQSMLGHASPQSTAIYTQFNPGNAVAAVTALAPDPG